MGSIAAGHFSRPSAGAGLDGLAISSGQTEMDEEIDLLRKTDAPRVVLGIDVAVWEVESEAWSRDLKRKLRVSHCERRYAAPSWKHERKQLRVVASVPVTILPAGPGWEVGRSRWRIENGTFNVLTRDYSLTHNYHHSVAAIVALLAMRSFACFLTQAYWSHATARSQNAPSRFVQWFQQVVIEDWVRYLDGALLQNLASGLIQDPGKRAQLLGQPDQQGSVDPLEIEWKRKDHTALKVRLSGQEILGEQGQLDAYEVITEDVTKQRQLEDHLRQQAARDPLTGLANYRHLAEVLDMENKRSERTGREFALLLFDLDGLKQINDRYGHLTGSHALCRVADVLSFCRDIDTAARYGGDEFAVVLSEIGAEAANQVAQRICDSIANDGMEPLLSVSIGVAVYPHDGERMEALLRKADAAMYAMKTKKRELFDARPRVACQT